MPDTSTETNRNARALLFIIVIGLVWMWYFFHLAPERGPDASSSQPATVASMGKFLAIQNGMEMSDVNRIMQVGGDLVASSSVANIVTEQYLWKNPNGSNMTVMFQHGKVVMKAQYGLPD